MFLRKAVASTSMVSERALPIDVHAAHDPAGGPAVAVGGAEGAEVVLADQRGGRARASPRRPAAGARARRGARRSGERTKWFQTV